jgi:RNA polymerase sigma-70 factor (ECF subfamily)
VLAESHRDLLRFVTRRIGSSDEAEDVLSTFYLRSLSHAFEIRHPQSLRGWLRRVLETTIIDYYREKAAHEKIGTNLDEARIAYRPDAGEIDKAICTCFYKLLPLLKPAYADVLRRIDLEEESREDVATSLGITVNNVTVRLHRARSALRRRLMQTCLTCPDHGFFNCQCAHVQPVQQAIRSQKKKREV